MNLTRFAFLTCLLALFAAGCAEPEESGNSDADSSQPGTDGDEKVIAYSTMDLTNPFFNVISDHMKEEGAKLGYKVITVSGDNATKQAEQIDDFIVQGVDAIVLTPTDPKSLGQAIKKANEAGIPVFTNDTAHDGEEGEVKCHIATDNLQGGRLAGEAMVRLLGESGGNVYIIHKPDAASCILRVQGFREVVDAHNAKDGAAQIKVVGEGNGDGKRDIGYNVAKDAIVANQDLSAIFAINDPCALGARTALEEAGRQDQVTIIGFDGEKAGKEAIRDGKILCDPIQFPDRMGKMTVEIIHKYMNGEDFEKKILIESSLYYKEDADKDPALKAEE